MNKRFAKIISLLGALSFGSILIGCGEQVPTVTIPPAEEDAVYCISYPLPDDGSKPTDHTGIENLAYMVNRFEAQENYHIELVGEVSAKILIDYRQKVNTYKDYRDGVLVTSDFSSSDLVNNAIQTCFMDKTALIRRPVSQKPSSWNGYETEWQTDKDDIEMYSLSTYLPTYGLFSTEFSSYILNEDTILSASEVTMTAQGYYEQTFEIDPVEASVYYRARMKTMGGLADYPVIDTVRITYVFDDTWSVISSHCYEHYAIRLNAIIATDDCTATTVSTYSYGNADMRAYDDFFVNLRGEHFDPVEPQPEQPKEPTATDYLLEAFGPVLMGEGGFDLRLNVGDTAILGSIGLNLAEERGVLKLGSLLIGYDGAAVVVSYGDLKGRLPLEVFEQKLDEYISADGSASQPEGEEQDRFDTDALLEDLSAGVIEIKDNQVTLSVKLRFKDLELPIVFTFQKDDAIHFEKAEVSLDVDGKPVDLLLTPASVIPSMPEDCNEDLTFLIDDVFELLRADSRTISLSFTEEETKVSAELVLGKDALSLSATVDMKEYSFLLSAVKQGESVYLSLDQVNGERAALRLCGSMESVKKAMESFVGETPSVALGDILEKLLALNYDEVVLSLSAADGMLTATLDLTSVLETLGVEIELSPVTLTLTNGVFRALVDRIDVAMQAGGDVLVPEGTYTSADAALEKVDSLLSLVKSGDLFVTLEGTLRYGEKDFAIEGKAKLAADTVVMDLTIAGKRINLVYDDRISLVVPAWGLGVECTAEEFEEIFSSISKTSEGEESDALTVSVDLAKILRSIEAFADESALLGLKIDLSSVKEGLILTASVHEDSIALKSTDITAEGFTVKSLSLLIADGKDRTVEIVPASVSLHKAEMDSLLQLAKAERFQVVLYSDSITAEATIGTDGKISGSFAQKYVRGTFAMEGETVYLKVGTLAVRCGLDSVQDALSTLFGVNGLTDQDASQTSELILDLLNWDLGGVRWQTYDGKLGATIDTPALMKQFGVDYDLPELRMDYSYTTHTLWAGMDGVSVTVAPTERKYHAPSGSYASLDALLSGLKNAIGIQANTSVDVDGTVVTLELRGEFVWDGKVSDGAFVLRGVIEAQIDSVTMDGSFETDGKRLRLSIGSFGVELGFDEIESLMAKLPEVADQISENITNVPQGSIDTVDRLNVLFAALGLFDAAPDLSGLETLFGGVTNEEEILKDLADSLTGGYVREWNGKLQASVPSVSIGDFSTGAISMELYLSSGEEILADPIYCNGIDAEHWTKEDFDWLLDAVVGTSSLVCNESFTLDYQFDILSDDEAYRAYEGVRFRADGTLRYYTGEDANLRVYLYVDLTLQATNLTKDGDLYMTLTIYDNDNNGEVEVYVSASRYPMDAAEYSPLKLSIAGEELGELVATVMRLADIDFSLFNDLLTSDFLAKLDGLRSGSIGIDDVINDTVNGVIDSVPVPDGENISIQSGRLNDYLKTLSVADRQLSIVLDSAKVFGQSGLEDLSITLGVDEENRLNAFGFRGVHFLSDGPTEHLNGSFTMHCEPFAFGVPSDLDLYIDATGTMDLVEELLSSAVHSGSEGYVCNEEFAISGTATMTILLYDVSTNISMQLSMGESGDTALKFRFVTSGKRLFVDLVKGDTVTDITIRFPEDGPAMVYMERKQTTYFNWIGIKKKYSTPVIERRTMSLDGFMDDILGQIGFIFNLGDVLLDAMNSESATEENSNDYGNYLKSFTMASDQYTVVLDGGNLTGGVLGTLKLGVRRDNGLIGGLNINTSIYTILKLNANLTYLNAGDNHENVPANFTRDLVEEGVF